MTEEHAQYHELPEEIAPTIVYDESLEHAPFHVFVNTMLASAVVESTGIPPEELSQVTLKMEYKRLSSSYASTGRSRKDRTITLNTAYLPNPEKTSPYEISKATAKFLAHESRHLVDKKDLIIWTTDAALAILTMAVPGILGTLGGLGTLSHSLKELEVAPGLFATSIILLGGTGIGLVGLGTGWGMYYFALSPMEKRARLEKKRIAERYPSLYSPSAGKYLDLRDLIHLTPK